MKFTSIIGMFFFMVQLQAQNSESDYEKNTNIGMKLGISASTIFGGELQNPNPLLGYTAGIYYHTKLDKRKIHYQTGIDLRLRGSNFNNVNDSMSNRAYTRIGLISLDIPLHALILVGNYSKEKACAIKAFSTQAITNLLIFNGPWPAYLKDCFCLLIWPLR